MGIEYYLFCIIVNSFFELDMTHMPKKIRWEAGLLCEIEGLVVDLCSCQMELFLLVTPSRDQHSKGKANHKSQEGSQDY